MFCRNRPRPAEPNTIFFEPDRNASESSQATEDHEWLETRANRWNLATSGGYARSTALAPTPTTSGLGPDLRSTRPKLSVLFGKTRVVSGSGPELLSPYTIKTGAGVTRQTGLC